MVATILPALRLLTLGVNRSILTFSEHGHVAYQIQENHECINMVPNILPADPTTPNLKMRSISPNLTFFQDMIMLRIKLTRITNESTLYIVSNILLADPLPLNFGMGSIDQNSTFSEHGHVAYQMKGNHKFSNMEVNILHT